MKFSQLDARVVHVWCTHCPYMGCLNNCPGEPWRRRWTKLRLQCHCMSTEREGVMWVDSHRLGCHNLGTRTRCSNGESRVRRRNENRYWHRGGVGGVHLLHGSVLCTLPLTSGGVGIGLGLPRLLVLFVDRGVCSVLPAWSASHSLQSSSPILGFSSCRR